MLDRKTKDIEAGIELLEDRRKLTDAVIVLFMMVFIAVIAIIAFIFYTFTSVDLSALTTYSQTNLIVIFITGMTFLIFVLSWCLFEMARMETKKDYYNILLYLKQREKKK